MKATNAPKTIPCFLATFLHVNLAMAPVPASISTAAMLGGSEAPVSWNTYLAFGAILFATMQGMLCMESADPCRISYQKLLFLLVLELLEVGVMISSEVVSFLELRGPLRERLTWLQWLPACLLVLGLLELFIDVYFTVGCAVQSRINWLPFSAVRYRKNPDKLNGRLLLEVAPLVVTAGMSLVLFGWRQKWWLVREAVNSDVARAAATATGALSNGWLGFCFAWCFFLTVAATGGVTIGIIQGNVFDGLGDMLNPKRYYVRNPHIELYYGKEDRKERMELYEMLYKEQYGSKALEKLTESDKLRNLNTAPLSVGNAIVGVDQSNVFNAQDEGGASFYHLLILFVEHFSIIPLQICIVVAVFELHDKMDLETFQAMKNLVDAVIVVAFLDIATGLKVFLWGAGRVTELHDYDRRTGDPLRSEASGSDDDAEDRGSPE